MHNLYYDAFYKTATVKAIRTNARQAMLDLGILYSYDMPHPFDGIWVFFNCRNVPKKLPEYLYVGGWTPSEFLGHGLPMEKYLQIMQERLKK